MGQYGRPPLATAGLLVILLSNLQNSYGTEGNGLTGKELKRTLCIIFLYDRMNSLERSNSLRPKLHWFGLLWISTNPQQIHSKPYQWNLSLTVAGSQETSENLLMEVPRGHTSHNTAQTISSQPRSAL